VNSSRARQSNPILVVQERTVENDFENLAACSVKGHYHEPAVYFVNQK
jgi:hypothetical protein